MSGIPDAPYTPIVPLPWREPAGRKVTGQIMGKVPADVLMFIADYLQFSDRLSFALVSKHICSVILHIRRVVCTRTEQVWRLHAYLRADTDVRAPRLVSLALHLIDLRGYSESDDERSFDKTLSVVIDILCMAKNLRQLSTDNDWSWSEIYYSCKVLGPSLLDAIGKLSALMSVQLASLTTPILFHPGLFPTRMKRLHLRSYRNTSARLSVHDLCTLLTTLPSLSSLTLEFFPASVFPEFDQETPVPVINSLRTFALISTWLPYHTARFLPQVFPNLEKLAIISCNLSAPRPLQYEYPSLRHVVCHTLLTDREKCIDVPYPVDRATVFQPEMDFHTHAHVHFLETPRVVGITVRGYDLKAWARYLWKPTGWYEFECSQKTLTIMLSKMRHYMAIQESPYLTIRFLSVLAPSSSPRWPGSEERTYSKFLHDASLYFPRLRFVALGHAPSVHPFDRQEDYTSDMSLWRWWSIIRDASGAPVDIREVPDWMGERVRAYVHAADAEAMNKFDDMAFDKAEP